METMTVAFERTAVERHAASPAALEAASVDVFLSGDPLSASRPAVAASFFLRKIGSFEEGRFRVDVEDATACKHVEAYLAPRPGVAGFLAWVDAADFLLASPPRPVIWAALCTTLGDWGGGQDLRAPDFKTRADVGEFFFLRRTPTEDSDSYAPVPETSRLDGLPECGAIAEAVAETWSVSELCCRAGQVWRVLFHEGPSPARASRADLEFFRGRLVLAVLRRVGAGPAGALDVLAAAGCLLDTFCRQVARWLVYRALRAVYVAEAQGHLCSVPLATVHALQILYVSSALDLDVFVPVSRPTALWRRTLPGLRGRDEVARLVATEAQLERRLLQLVPWLGSGSLTLDLQVTGSMLCHALLECASSDADWPGPGDVDVFCAREELPRAEEEVAVAMTQHFWSDGESEISREQLNASRRVLRADGLPEAAARCDLYVNTLAQVQKYHLPMVRASWSLRSRRLYLAPSCAIALATGLSVDANTMVSSRSKTPMQILANKWLWGFNFCMRNNDVVRLCTYLQTTHPAAFQRALQRAPCRGLTLGSFSQLEDLYVLSEA